MLAATLYQGNNYMNHKLWNIGSTKRYILHMLKMCHKIQNEDKRNRNKIQQRKL